MTERRVDEEKRATLRRFAALGAATPFVGLGRGGEPPSPSDEDAGTDVRSAIVGYLTATPGAHFSKVRDDLQLGTGETQHHLKRLLDSDAVESVRDGEYRRFFLAGRFSSFEQVALGYLRRRTPRGMIIELLRDPEATGADLAESLGVSRATVSSSASDLAAVGLLSREDGYAVERPETLITLLVRYADSFGPDAVSFAADAADYIRFDP